MIKDNYQLLIEKLDQFIRKYYFNQLIRGTLYSVALILALFIAFNVLEYYFYFGKGMRKLLFYTFNAATLLAMGNWIFLPLLHYFRLGKVISHEQAARIIGDHFTDVKDKLLNILQLKKQSFSSSQAELIQASINQKSEQLSPVPFKSAINLAQNRKYLRYALPPMLLLLLLLIAAPSIIREGSKRIINNNREFAREAPFRFVVDRQELRVVQFDDYELKVGIEGNALPNEVFIEVDNVQYRLTKEKPNLFSYKFTNVQKETEFHLFAGGFRSDTYELDVLKKPNIAGFQVMLDYPDYTGRKDEALNNVGDLVVPAGTQIEWSINAQYTDQIQIRFSGNSQREDVRQNGTEHFAFKKRVVADETYKLYISNKNLPNGDSVSYTITVVPDLYPSISVEKFADSLDNKTIFFAGDASDDYGLRSLSFNYRIIKSDGKEGPVNSVKLQKPEGKQIQYQHTFDVRTLSLKPGEEVNYYFEVIDNDAIAGGKPARTNTMSYRLPTEEELQKLTAQNNDEIKKDLENALKESKKIQDELKRLREKFLQQKDLDWQNRKEVEKLLNRQKELDKKVEQAKQKFEENKKNEADMEKSREELSEKQEQLDKIFDQLQNEEMKQLMQQIEELMQKMEKDQALDMMEKFQYNNEELQMQMDRMLELFKNLEVEQMAKEAADKLEELAKQQEDLSKETENNQQPQNELERKQDDINKEFDKLQDKFDDLQKKNKELEKPKELGLDKEQSKDVEKDLKDSKDQLNQKQNNKASKSQKKAANKMKDMANKMKSSMESAEMEQMEEDMQALRQLLENLMTMSFDQERLMTDFNNAQINTPRYVTLVQQQYKLKDDFQLIQDSLQALSKRIYQIESFVTEKVADVKQNLAQSLDKLEERQKPQAAENQQRTMKNVNDLALMLSESMNQMQQQMNNGQPGSGSCKKPGGKGQKPSDSNAPKDKMSQGQKGINDQLKKMKEGLEKGGQPGKGADAKQFAEMAAKQAALRKALRELQKEKQQRGQGTKETQDIIDQMDKVETELVNKRLTNETLKRAEDIQVRLLESERAEREREYDEKRKAETARETERRMPPSLQEYLKKREAEIEMYRTVSPSLKPYYKFLVEEYQKSLKKR